MSLDAKEQAIVREVFSRADAQISMDVANGVLDGGTSLAVFGVIRDVVRGVDPRFAEFLVPHKTEDAASQIVLERKTNATPKGTL